MGHSDTGDKPEYCSECRGFAPFDGDHPHTPPTQSESELTIKHINPVLGHLFSTGETAHNAGLTQEMRLEALRSATRDIEAIIASRERAARVDLASGLHSPAALDDPKAYGEWVYYQISAELTKGDK